MFCEEHVIAIGYALSKVDPSEVAIETLEAEIATRYPDKKSPSYAARKLKEFVSMRPDDVALICRGYNASQSSVYIYGLARVRGPFRKEPFTGRLAWRFKHDADILRIEKDLPRAEVAACLDEQALIGSLHRLNISRLDGLKKMLSRQGMEVPSLW
jgi:hypothetical protein